MHHFTDDEKKFFKNYVTGHSYKEIQSEFIKIFGWDISISQIKNFIGRYRLKTGLTGQFKKGTIPHNKGKKMSLDTYEKVKHTMFKKGNIPKNHRDIGSERLTKDGYIEIKIKEPNVWKLKHRYIWEQEHGEIPLGNIIIFRDGDKTNVSIDNLMMIDRKTHAVLNKTKLYKFENELKDTAVKIAHLKIAVNDARKNQIKT